MMEWTRRRSIAAALVSAALQHYLAQAAMRRQRFEVALIVQQRDTLFDAKRSDQDVNRLADGGVQLAQPAVQARCCHAVITPAQRHTGERRQGFSAGATCASWRNPCSTSCVIRSPTMQSISPSSSAARSQFTGPWCAPLKWSIQTEESTNMTCAMGSGPRQLPVSGIGSGTRRGGAHRMLSCV